MDLAKLFRVVVIGGALLSAHGCGDETDDVDGPDDPARSELPDAAAEADGDAGAQMADAGGEVLEDCGFCPNDICCEIDDTGTSVLRDGFECCWSTSC